MSHVCNPTCIRGINHNDRSETFVWNRQTRQSVQISLKDRNKCKTEINQHIDKKLHETKQHTQLHSSFSRGTSTRKALHYSHNNPAILQSPQSNASTTMCSSNNKKLLHLRYSLLKANNPHNEQPCHWTWSKLTQWTSIPVIDTQQPRNHHIVFDPLLSLFSHIPCLVHSLHVPARYFTGSTQHGTFTPLSCSGAAPILLFLLWTTTAIYSILWYKMVSMLEA